MADGDNHCPSFTKSWGLQPAAFYKYLFINKRLIRFFFRLFLTSVYNFFLVWFPSVRLLLQLFSLKLNKESQLSSSPPKEFIQIKEVLWLPQNKGKLSSGLKPKKQGKRLKIPPHYRSTTTSLICCFLSNAKKAFTNVSLVLSHCLDTILTWSCPIILPILSFKIRAIDREGARRHTG